MNKKLIHSLAIGLALCLPAAANTDQTVESVSSAVTVAEGVDYHITSSTPFATGGSVNLTKGGTAVVILDHVKPSAALSLVSTNITIDGAKAVRGTNCDVRLYAGGTIIFPYTENDQPLTVYSEQNFGGTAVSDFGLEDTGGYMNTLTDAKLNNKIRSFKLRRGYMVTFATSSGGYGYSRCFIADDQDLEFATLPTLLDKRISSYRIFKWTDASKKGLANDTRATTNDLLGTTSCYSFGNGENTGIDRECVRHHIKEGWPSIASIGENNYTTSNPTVKTNNEPGNSADDSPCTVDEVLANWQALMATGKRLCSPSSHDGSLSWLRNFMDSIDARGWRCDVLDMHCYWPEGSFSGLASWYNSYKRPIWVSEWVWGASWNKNGAFSTGYTDDQAKAENAKVIKRLIDKMEGWDYVERYFYWNSEADRSKLVIDGALTAAGEQYAALESKVGYKRSLDYVPTAPKMKGLSDLTLTFLPNKAVSTLAWKNLDGEYADSIFVERKVGEERGSKWEVIASVDVQESTTYTYSYKDTTANSGNYYYRIRSVDYKGTTHYTSEVLNPVGGTTGFDNVQWGTFEANSTDEAYNFYHASFDEKPSLVFGGTSSANSSVVPMECIASMPVQNKKYSYYVSKYFPWNSSKDNAEMTENEISSYLVAQRGNGTLGSLAYEAGAILNREKGSDLTLKNDTVEYTFNQPFDEAPVVFVTPQSMSSNYPVSFRVWDVTKNGFKIVGTRQQAMDEKYSGFSGLKVNYFAIEKGLTLVNGKRFEVRDTTLSFTNLGSAKTIKFSEKMENPVFLMQMQTFNRKICAVLRSGSSGVGKSSCLVKAITDTSSDDRSLSTANPLTENIGWMLISDYDDPSGIDAPKATAVNKELSIAVNGGQLSVSEASASSVRVFNAAGAVIATAQFVDGKATINVASLPTGILFVKTNNGMGAKVVIGR